MSPRSPSGSSQAQHAYVPPHIQQAMNQHMQQSMPANLKKYVGGNTYIPQSAQVAMAKQMQKTMPAHMKQYITPYLHQQDVAGQMALHTPASARPTSPRPPSPNLMRRDHSLGFGQQYKVALDNQNPNANQGSVAFTAQYQESQPTPAQPAQPDYSFITSPATPAPKRPLPGANSLLGRALWAAAGVVVLIIAFSIVKSIISGPGPWPEYVSVAQDQVEISHLSQGAILQQNGISTFTKNLALTTQLSMNSAESATLQYLANNGHKANKKQLNLKVSVSLDTQLSNAATVGNYDSLFQQTMKSQLTAYQHDLQTAYIHSSGPKGRALLNQDYNGAGLLLTQLQTQYQ